MIQSPYGLRPSGNYTDQPYKGGEFSSFIDQKINKSVKGDIVGPFVTGDKIQLVKNENNPHNAEIMTIIHNGAPPKTPNFNHYLCNT